MSVLVTTAGLGREDAAPEFLTVETLPAKSPAAGGLAVDLPNDRDPAELVPRFGDLALIRVAFPAMGDGRGFSLARRLRELGYRGRLRAFGPLVPDQVRAAFRVGFDEIELPAEHAARSPEARWQPRGQGSYQDRLAG
jgi:uncharacterized protein (DUF934 family)